MKKLWILMSIILVFALALTGCSGGSTTEDPCCNNNDCACDPCVDGCTCEVIVNNNCPICDQDPCVCVVSSYTINSPYADVNWDTWGQFRAGHHTHTTSSDGSANLTAMINRYYELGYDALAITDHNYMWPVTIKWTDSPRAGNNHANSGPDAPLAQSRYDEVTTGVGRSPVRPMLEIPASSEIAVFPDEMNTFWYPGAKGTQYNGVAGFKTVLDDMKANYPDALAHVNHPGRATGGAGAGAVGLAQSNNPTNIKKYADLFRDYTQLVGQEIINRSDGDSRHDRVLWDNILKVIIPEGKRNIWGFANDDAHSASATSTAIAWNIMIMEENTVANIRKSMIDGTFYAVSRVAHRELGQGVGSANIGSNSVPSPKITKIEIADNDSLDASITITVQNATKIQWISDGEIVLEGAPADVGKLTLKDANLLAKIGCYVRVNVMGTGGIAFTQPIIIEKEFE